jgi:hypothetical protein
VFTVTETPNVFVKVNTAASLAAVRAALFPAALIVFGAAHVVAAPAINMESISADELPTVWAINISVRFDPKTNPLVGIPIEFDPLKYNLVNLAVVDIVPVTDVLVPLSNKYVKAMPLIDPVTDVLVPISNKYVKAMPLIDPVTDVPVPIRYNNVKAMPLIDPVTDAPVSLRYNIVKAMPLIDNELK